MVVMKETLWKNKVKLVNGVPLVYAYLFIIVIIDY